MYDVNDPRITPAVREALDRVLPAAKALLDACETPEERHFYAEFIRDELAKVGEPA